MLSVNDHVFLQEAAFAIGLGGMYAFLEIREWWRETKCHRTAWGKWPWQPYKPDQGPSRGADRSFLLSQGGFGEDWD